MCQVIPRQQVRWGLQFVPSGLEVMAEKVWRELPGSAREWG